MLTREFQELFVLASDPSRRARASRGLEKPNVATALSHRCAAGPVPLALLRARRRERELAPPCEVKTISRQMNITLHIMFLDVCDIWHLLRASYSHGDACCYKGATSDDSHVYEGIYWRWRGKDLLPGLEFPRTRQPVRRSLESLLESLHLRALQIARKSLKFSLQQRCFRTGKMRPIKTRNNGER